MEGDDGICALLYVGEAQSGGVESSVASVGAVQLVQVDVAAAMQKLITSLRSI